MPGLVAGSGGETKGRPGAPECGRLGLNSLGCGKKLSPDALPGGGGQRVRAHVLDSESGGAKGHYPNRSTTQHCGGSTFFENFFEKRQPRRRVPVDRVEGARRCPSRRTRRP